jgi:hypothetical protein
MMWARKRMPKAKAKIPFSFEADALTLRISDDDWCRIEAQSFGYPILAGTRKRIIEATGRYLDRVALESNAAPTSMALDRLQEIKSAAKALHAVITKKTLPVYGPGFLAESANHQWASADFYTRYLIASQLCGNSADGLAKLESLALQARAVVRACNDVLRYSERLATLRQDTSDQPEPNQVREQYHILSQGFGEGEAWAPWICQLYSICKSDGLPVGVRKDSGNDSLRRDGTVRSARPSRFVMFVHEVQKCFPLQYRRPIQSLQALAVAIVNATRSIREPKASRTAAE